MEGIIKIVKSLQDSGLLLKGVSETGQNGSNKQRERLFSMLLGTLGASLLGKTLAGKEMDRAGEGFFRVCYGSSIKNKNF